MNFQMIFCLKSQRVDLCKFKLFVVVRYDLHFFRNSDFSYSTFPPSPLFFVFLKNSNCKKTCSGLLTQLEYHNFYRWSTYNMWKRFLFASLTFFDYRFTWSIMSSYVCYEVGNCMFAYVMLLSDQLNKLKIYLIWYLGENCFCIADNALGVKICL